MRNPFTRLVWAMVIFIAVLTVVVGAKCWAADAPVLPGLGASGATAAEVGVTAAVPPGEGGTAAPAIDQSLVTSAATSGLFGPVLNALGAKSGWLLALMTWMAALRVFFKPVMTAIEKIVKDSPSTRDDEVLLEVEHSKAYGVFCWLLDLIASVKFGPQFTARAQGPADPRNDGYVPASGNLTRADQLVKTASPAAESGKGGGNRNGIVTAIGIIFLILGTIALPICFTGCAGLAPQGIYHGDKIAYDADAIIDGAYAALDSFVQWHRANAAVVDAKWPEIADFARLLESGQGDQWIDDALDLRDAYSKNPSTENRTKLQQGLAVLQTALAKAAVYQARLAIKPNH